MGRIDNTERQITEAEGMLRNVTEWLKEYQEVAFIQREEHVCGRQ